MLVVAMEPLLPPAQGRMERVAINMPCKPAVVWGLLDGRRGRLDIALALQGMGFARRLLEVLGSIIRFVTFVVYRYSIDVWTLLYLLVFPSLSVKCVAICMFRGMIFVGGCPPVEVNTRLSSYVF
jgi:hypothetical protein